MSKRYWIAAVAFGVAALCSATFWWWLELSEYQVQHAKQRQESSSNETGDVEKYKRCLLHGGYAFDFIACLYEAGTPQSEASYAKYDLEAQQDMAEFAFTAVVVSAVGSVVSVFGLGALIFSLALTRKAVEATYDVERAWLIPSGTSIGAIIDEKGINIGCTVALIISNDGRAPAIFSACEIYPIVCEARNFIPKYEPIDPALGEGVIGPGRTVTSQELRFDMKTIGDLMSGSKFLIIRCVSVYASATRPSQKCKTDFTARFGFIPTPDSPTGFKITMDPFTEHNSAY